MSRDALKTLFYPFEAEALPLPAKGSRALFLGAEPGFRLPDGFGAALSLVQGFRPYFASLQSAGHHVTQRAEGEGYELALVLAGRHRGLNELRIADGRPAHDSRGLGGAQAGRAALHGRQPPSALPAGAGRGFCLA